MLGALSRIERHFADDLLAFCFVSWQYVVALLERAASLAVAEAAMPMFDTSAFSRKRPICLHCELQIWLLKSRAQTNCQWSPSPHSKVNSIPLMQYLVQAPASARGALNSNSRNSSSALALQLHCSYTANMSTLRFEWDERKAAANERKHGVSFEEARTVFFDERARLVDDPDHSEDEERFVLLGLSGLLRLLLVCHCYRSDANGIRIISARKATARESKSYP